MAAFVFPSREGENPHEKLLNFPLGNFTAVASIKEKSFSPSDN
jgi:hypothetical protein